MYEYGNNKHVKCHEHNPYVNLKTSLATSAILISVMFGKIILILLMTFIKDTITGKIM